MAQALRLAARGRATTPPNPMVGALVVAQGRSVAAGYHHHPGGPHAEVLALQHAGARARGATLYVTLEPCSHHQKRTPPCVPAVIQAGIARVVVAMRDPNPEVNGRGLAQLRQAGVQISEGILRPEAERLNEGYVHRMRTGRPRVLLKAAMTLDGQLATPSGESRWITGLDARRYVHRLRRQMDAILVGLQTVLQDDPELTARDEGPGRRVRYATRQPLRIVLDSRLQIPPQARLLRAVAGARTLIATTTRAPRRRIEQLRGDGIEVIVLPTEQGRVSLRACLTHLAQRGVNTVMIEGGGEVNATALRAGLVDELRLILAPRLLGGQDAVGLLGGRAPKQLAEAIPLTIPRLRRLGTDLLIEALPTRRRPGHAASRGS